MKANDIKKIFFFLNITNKHFILLIIYLFISIMRKYTKIFKTNFLNKKHSIFFITFYSIISEMITGRKYNFFIIIKN